MDKFVLLSLPIMVSSIAWTFPQLFSDVPNSGWTRLMGYRVSIDIGGTFTDCVVVDEAGLQRIFKTPSTPGEFERGFMNAISLAAAAHDLSVDTFLTYFYYIARKCILFLIHQQVHSILVSSLKMPVKISGVNKLSIQELDKIKNNFWSWVEVWFQKVL